jgi:hypothetical protein
MTGGPFGRAGGKTPSQLRKLIRPIFEAADYRGTIGRPDVFAGFQIWGRVGPCHRNAGLTEGPR